MYTKIAYHLNWLNDIVFDNDRLLVMGAKGADSWNLQVLKNIAGRPSGPPLDLIFSLLIARLTRFTVKQCSVYRRY